MDASTDFRMTIGARVGPDGTSFRVWAPEAEQVDVVLYGPGVERVEPMEEEGDGYFAMSLSDVAAGARYRYRLGGGEVYPEAAGEEQALDRR
ncbi:MAG: malto-oligosyltrehalose trehalohydrolase, partial [Gemmatimonadota bacterium]